MNRLFLIVCLLIACASSARADAAVDTAYAQSGPLKIGSVRLNADSVPRYGKLEITIDLSATYTNPFDPDQIDVGADFSGPDREWVHVNGFLDQEYRTVGSTRVPDGPPVWKVRFAPTASGTWHYHVDARDKSGAVRSPSGKFRVTPSTDRGYVRVSTRNPYVFAFRDETPYFPIGEDMCWSSFGDPGLGSYADWLKKLHAAGGNWVRIWMCSWSNGIEWKADAQKSMPGYHGLGVYNLDNADRLDRILDLAHENGIYVMLCLDTFGELSTGGYFNEGQWKDNPYNAANGGPCAKPDDFFTSPVAQKLYRQRLRYIAARYGYRTGLQSWEFWNEENAPAPWIAQMAEFLKGTGPYVDHPADPAGHLITTTYGNADVWKIPEVDWTQSHLYGTGDIPDLGPPIAADAVANMAYKKPHLMAEFGIDYRKADTAYDPNGLGVDLHNGLWSSATSGAAGSAMIWWWDSYVDPKNLYHEFAPLSMVASKIEWTATPTRLLTFDAITQKVAVPGYVDLTLPARTGWGKQPTEFHVDANSLGSDSYPTFLYGPDKAKDLVGGPTFDVDYPAAGQFIVHVNQVSNAATLQIAVDGAVAATFHLNAAPPTDGRTPEYKSTELNQQYKIYQAVFDKDYSVDVPAGSHKIAISVPDGDWISVDSYRLTGYRSNRYANAGANGVAVGRSALVWLHNLDHNWKNAYDKVPNTVIRGATTTVHGLDKGIYRATWFDTETGKTLRVERVVSTPKGAVLTAPTLTTDYAVLLQREK